MLDPKLFRNNLDELASKLQKRGFELDVERLKSLEETRRVVQVECENLQQERNTRSKNIGKAKAAGEDIQPLLQEVESLKSSLAASEAKLSEVQIAFDEIVAGVPNVLDKEVF